jgi:hypothetical protein
MRKLRFNIANLLVIILVAAIGFAALRESTDLWESGILTATVAILLIATLLAVHRTELRRAFWFGFALFGGAYLALSLVPSIEARLITTKALAYLDSKVPGRPTSLYTIINSGTVSGTGNTAVQSVTFGVTGIQAATVGQGQVWIRDVTPGGFLSGWSGTTENFVQIGHSLFALLLGWLGGQLSRRLYRPSNKLSASGIGGC